MRHGFCTALFIVSATAAMPAYTATPVTSSAPMLVVPGARVVTITPAGQTGSEPAIAVNPANPDQVVGVAPHWVAYSSDGGRTFTPVDMSGRGLPSIGDVSLAFDSNGQLYLSYLAIERNGLPGYWAHGVGANGIWVLHSGDGGRTWDREPVPVKIWNGSEPDIKLEDMPRIWADTQPASHYRGNLYMAWIEWQLTQSVILYSRSTDGGRTWSTARRISTRAGLPRDDNGAVVAPIGAVGADGTQYVVWNEGLNITLAVSRDGGATFTPSRPIFDVAAPYFGGANGIPGVSRAMGFPQIGVDPNSGVLYVTWSDFRNGDVDVFISVSRDLGRTWSRPLRVNDDPVHDGADQFLQWLAVDPIDGSVNVQFYDRRDDPTNRRTRVTLARSTDGGRSFRNYAWSADAFGGDNAFLGDYEWLVAYGGRVYGIWAEAAPEDYVLAHRPDDTPTMARRTPTIVRVGTGDFAAPHAE